MKMSQVVTAAESKFGQVVGCSQTAENSFALTILRDNPTFKDAPFMTIQAYQGYAEGAVAFERGHYDLTAAQVGRKI